jgi:hypothetical protein
VSLLDCQTGVRNLSDHAISCRKSGEAFANWEARFKNATMAMDVLTSNTCLMLVASEPWVGECICVHSEVFIAHLYSTANAEPALLMFNIRQARKHFEELQGTSVSTPCL